MPELPSSNADDLLYWQVEIAAIAATRADLALKDDLAQRQADTDAKATLQDQQQTEAETATLSVLAATGNAYASMFATAIGVGHFGEQLAAHGGNVAETMDYYTELGAG